MKKAYSPFIFGLAIFALATLTYQFFQGNAVEKIPYNPAYDAYLSAFTDGVIAKRSNIIVRFQHDRIGQSPANQPLEQSPFAFEPELAGDALWLDSRTLAFIPKEPLPSGQTYTASLDLKNIVPDIAADLREFPFQFTTKQQQLTVAVQENNTLTDGDKQWQQVKGEISTADFAEDEQFEKLFHAEKNGQVLAIKWQHYADEQRHTFVIDSIEREQREAQVTLAWNAEDFGGQGDERRFIPVHAKGLFKQTGIRKYETPSQHIVVEFSDAINTLANLEGLVHLGEHASHIAVEGNRVKIYPKKRLSGDVEVIIEPGIANNKGQRIDSRISQRIRFEALKPELRLEGTGTIMPNSGKLPFLFSTIGLNAVDVRVIKIYEDNIPQFLQVNKISESNELKRVGQQVYKQRFDLNGQGVDLFSWNIHSLDLSGIIAKDPGAIYEVAIGFSKDYSLCDCAEETEADATKSNDMLALDAKWNTYTEPYESSYWDYYDENARYEDRDNPCKNAYYHAERLIKRNVLASDLGLVAKQGAKGDMQFIVTNLQTASPMSGVELEVYDFQQRVMGTITTDGKGIGLVSNMPNKPYLLIAKQGKQRGYLRLDDGMMLALSRFDVQGQEYYQGVKGFIFAERGVWRPGDPIFVNFILEDKLGSLPANHPVTFELFDPRGKLMRKMTRSDAVGNFYPFHTSTDMDAPTGNYLAKVSVGGASFSKTMKVEMVIPNRLKIKLDFGKTALSSADENLQGSLDVKWLHGATAKGLDAEVEVSLTQGITQFPKYTDYVFDDPVRTFSVEDKRIFKGKLDDLGVAKIPAKFKATKASPGMLKANFKARAYEPGGNFSLDRFSVPYHPYKSYVGLKLPKGDAIRGMLLTDTDHNVEIATLDTEGNPVSKSNLEVKVYKLDWKWWWEKGEEELADYRGKMHKSPIQSGQASTTNGVGSWKFRINYPEWGRYLVRVCDGSEHCTGKIVYVDWPGWAGRDQGDSPGGASMLMFTSDKTEYTVGESITLHIPTGNAGKALVSIETGSRIVRSDWVDAEKGMTKFTFTATEDMAPNIYANVMLFQPHSQTQNDLPIRLYGIIPIKVEAPQTKLSPKIAMRDEIGPMEDVTVQVSETAGRDMTYTLAVVDEGLLDLTRFETPSPWHTFYQREALKVKTWDMFDDVMGAYGGQVKSLLTIGGDADGRRSTDSKQDRFKPVVLFLGPFKLNKGETKSHTFQMPNYVGSVRVMVVAGNEVGAYGSAEKAVPVRKPLMALATLPRVIGPGETFQLPVTIFAMEAGISEVTVTVEGNSMVSVGGIKTKTMRFTEIGEQMLNFEMKARSALGSGRVKVTAKSGAYLATYDVGIEVRTPNPRVANVFASAIDAGKSWEQSYTPVGMAETNTGKLEVSSIPPLNLGKHLEYLIQYPYGCVEQTTSSGFPQLYLSSLMELPSGMKDKIAVNIKATIERLRAFQLSDGGLAYWPGSSEYNAWGTNYAGHFLLEAQLAGYTVPAELLNQWKDFQAKEARKWIGKGQEEELTQSYRLYLLALARVPELGAMNRMRQQTGLAGTAIWNLAGAYALAGQGEVAKQLVANLGTSVTAYSELSGTYGSALRDEALILQTLTLLGDRTKAAPLVQRISDQLSGEQWLNTQATAYSLVAMAKYVGKSGVSSDMKFSYRINGGKWEDVKTDKAVWQMALAKVGADKVEFKNEGGGVLYARIILEGIPERGDQTEASNGLALNIAYKDMNGAAIDPGNLVQGTDFQVEVTMKNTGVRGDYQELALAQIFPSGWEIHNTRLDADGKYLGDKPEYQDLRDDRAYTFFDLRKGETKTFILHLHASYEGNFYLPTVAVEAMYDHGINARKPGAWVKVSGGN